MPTVSVLVPTYKPQQEHLRESLDGLLAQTETDWHCVVCDEPTEVDTHAILEPYLSDPRFSYHRNESCLGIGGNWNRCASHAKAEIIAYLFQDDLWKPNYLEMGQRALKENETAGFVSLGHEYFYEGEVTNKSGYEDVHAFREENIAPGLHTGTELLSWWIANELHPNIVGEPPFVMLRKSLYEEVGPFNEDMPQFLDVEYWLRCLMVSDWYNCVECLGGFRVHAAGASAQNEASGAGIYDRLRCFEQLIASLEGMLREEAIAARNRALEKMAKKFIGRLRSGKTVQGGAGSGDFKKFCLRHPILVGSSLAKAVLNTSEN